MATILVIEDEIELSRMMQLRLQGEGYQVELAMDGVEGIEKVASIKPDLVILDLVIPKIDGYRVCELIKHDEMYSHIPVIMVSVRSQEIEKKAGFAVGADAYFTKPYDPKLLLKKVKELLQT